MRRFFATNLLFVLGVNLLVKPVWIFGIDRQVQNLVGHQAFGLYAPLFNFCLIFQILLDFGINNFTTKTVSEDPQALRRIFPVMFSARLALILLYSVVVMAGAWLAGYRSTAEMLLMGGIVAIQAFSMLTMFLRANVAALHRFKLDGLLSVADRGLMIVACGLLLLWPAARVQFSIRTFVAVQAACYAVAALLALAVLRRVARVPLRLTLRPAQLWPVFRRSLPYALLVFLMAVYLRADAVLLERLLPGARGREEAGVYAAAYRPLEAFNMFAVLLAGMLLPMLSRMLATGQHVAPIVRLSMSLLFPAALLAAACSAAFGQEIMVLLYPRAGPEEGKVFGWLMAATPAYAVLYIYSTLLTAGGRLKQLQRISVLGIAVSLGVSIALIPRYGALGAAIGSCCTMWTVAVCFIASAHRAFRLPHNPRWVASLVGYGLLCGAAAVGARFLALSWVWQLATLCAFGAVLIPVFRFVRPGEVGKLLGGLRKAG